MFLISFKQDVINLEILVVVHELEPAINLDFVWFLMKLRNPVALW